MLVDLIPKKTYRTAVVATPYVGTSTAFCILDVLASVGRDWEMLHGDLPQSPVFATSLLSLDGQPYDDINGRRIAPDGALSDVQDPDLVIVPDLHVDPNSAPPDGFAPLAAWIRAAHDRGR